MLSSKTRRGRAPAAAVLAFATLVAAADAHAADWYVATPASGGSNANPCSEAAPCATLQHVFNLAAVADEDVVHVGPGEFPGRAVTGKRLTVEGAGSGTTASFDPARDTFLNAATTTFAALEMQNGGTIRRLRAQGGFGGADADPPAPAVYLHAGIAAERTYDVQSVVGIGGAKGAAGRPGLQINDVGGVGSPVVATVGGDSYFQGNAGTTPAVLVTGANVSAAMTGVTIAGPPAGFGAAVQSGAALTLANSNVLDTFGQVNGVVANAGAELTIRSSSITARQTGIFTSGFSDSPSSVTIEGSLVNVRKEAAAGSGYGVRAITSGAGRVTTLDIRGSTIVASGPNVLAGVHAGAAGGARSEAALLNTVVQATDDDGTPGDADLVADSAPNSVASATASYSSFNDRLEVDGGTASAPDAATNVAGDPAFTDPSKGNFVPLAGSVLIDRADPSGFGPGALDLAGFSRAIDGNGDCVRVPDIGAYEGAEAPDADCAPTVVIAGRPVRLTPQGVARVRVTCPSGGAQTCSGTLALRSTRPLRLRPGAPRAVVEFGAAPIDIASGQSSLVVFELARAHRRLVGRLERVEVIGTADLLDPDRGPGTSTRIFGLRPPPRQLRASSRRLRMNKRGTVRLRVFCPSWEIEACTGRATLRLGRKVLARAGATVPAGSVRLLTMKLSPEAQKRVRRRNRVRALLVLVSRDEAKNRARASRRVAITPAGRT